MRTVITVLVAGLCVPPAGAADPPKGWEFTGRTQTAVVELRARVTGHLTRLSVREGDAVKAGDLLAEIDPRACQLDLDVARARLKMAEARLQAARVKTGNARRLAENKVISPEEVALSVAAETEAETSLLVAKAETQRAELNLSWTRLAAPFPGRVGRAPVAVGSLVTADQTTVLTVVATDPLSVTFNVPEATMTQLRRDGRGEPARLNVAVEFAGEEGFPHAAKLESISPEVDPRTGTVRFRAVIPNPAGVLSPGMSARVRLTPPPR